MFRVTGLALASWLGLTAALECSAQQPPTPVGPPAPVGHWGVVFNNLWQQTVQLSDGTPRRCGQCPQRIPVARPQPQPVERPYSFVTEKQSLTPQLTVIDPSKHTGPLLGREIVDPARSQQGVLRTIVDPAKPQATLRQVVVDPSGGQLGKPGRGFRVLYRMKSTDSLQIYQTYAQREHADRIAGVLRKHGAEVIVSGPPEFAAAPNR